MSRKSSRVKGFSDKAAKDAEFERKLASDTEEGLEVFNAGEKGRGIRATQGFQAGDYVTRYRGELVAHKEAIKR